MTEFSTLAPSGDRKALDCKDYGADDDLTADFERMAERHPAQPAIVHNGTVISYRELAESVRCASEHYRASAISPGRSGLVGTVVSHNPGAAVYLLGALHSGVVYCPIDAAVPYGRRQTLAAVLGLDETSLIVADIGGLPSPRCTELPPPQRHPSNPAYVLCTSGSTGMPKPVLVSRQALTTTVRQLRRLFALTPDDRVLQFASLGWDTCLEEILPALTVGATLVFDDAAFCASFPRFVRMLADREITVIDLPTAFWHELVLFLHDEDVSLPECVRLVVIGGERMDPTRLRQWRELDAGRTSLLNTYGCTETTMVTHAAQLCGPDVEPAISLTGAQAPLGRALPHVRDHISDEGELWISGPSLASGYLDLPDATAAAFPTQDHGSGADRWFRTGDIVERDTDGLLHSKGRLDEQVKVLGVRVHPAEVEAQLNTHPAVGGAVVVGERRLQRTVLRAYVVAVAPVTAGELKQYLGERLPSQFVPSYVKFVAALEFTTSGKVDRAATQRAANKAEGKGETQ